MRYLTTPFFTVALAAIVLSGCASTADLKTPIANYQTATLAAQTALSGYEKTIDDTVLNQTTADALAKKGAVRPVKGDCPLHANPPAHCRIVLDENGEVHPLTSIPDDPVVRRIMAGMMEYAANLNGIVTTDTDTAVANATQKTVSDTKQLATDIDSVQTKLGKPSTLASKVGSYSTPVTDAVNFLADAYLEQKKIAALREATGNMDAIIDDLVLICGGIASSGNSIQRMVLSDAYQDASSAYVAQRSSSAKLAALQSAATAWDASLSIDPVAPFTELAKAHHTLTAAVHKDKPDFSDLWSALQRVITAADQVQKIVSEFQAAGNPPAKPAVQ